MDIAYIIRFPIDERLDFRSFQRDLKKLVDSGDIKALQVSGNDISMCEPVTEKGSHFLNNDYIMD